MGSGWLVGQPAPAEPAEAAIAEQWAVATSCTARNLGIQRNPAEAEPGAARAERARGVAAVVAEHTEFGMRTSGPGEFADWWGKRRQIGVERMVGPGSGRVIGRSGMGSDRVRGLERIERQVGG